MTAPFRVTIRVKNNCLVTARERLGYRTTTAFAKDKNLCLQVVSNYETMHTSPIDRTRGGYKESALRLADALYSDPDDLWPEECLRVTKTSVTSELSLSDVRQLVGESDPERLLVREADARLLSEAMATLDDKEKKVLDSMVVHEEPGSVMQEAMGLSHTRVWQLKNQALRKLHLYIDVKKKDERHRERLLGIK